MELINSKLAGSSFTSVVGQVNVRPAVSWQALILSSLMHSN